MKAEKLAAADEWISCRAASQFSGLTTRQLRNLAAAGYLKHRKIPGTQTRYSRQSLSRLMERTVFGESVGM